MTRPSEPLSIEAEIPGAVAPEGRADGTPEAVEKALEGFEKHYAAAAVFDDDRQLAAELRLEARPAVEALILALSEGNAEDPRSLGHHESLTMMTLWGRRAAVLGASPSGAVLLLSALSQSLRDVSLPPGEAVESSLRLAAWEGYVRGRDERTEARLAARASEAIVTLEVAANLWVLRLAGDHATEVLEAAIEDWSRTLHRRDARGALVDLSGLLGPSDRRASVLLQAEETARMLGVRCVFAGVSPEWRAALERVSGDGAALLTLVDDYGRGFAMALRDCGLQIAPTPQERLRRFVRR